MAQLSVRDLRKDPRETEKKIQKYFILTDPVATLKSQRL